MEQILRITKNLSRDADVTVDTISLGINVSEFARLLEEKSKAPEIISIHNPDPHTSYKAMEHVDGKALLARSEVKASISGKNARIMLDGQEIGFGEKWSIKSGGDDLRVKHSTIEHTRMRFNTMTKIQLWTRMGKTTTPEKLLAFSIVAEEKGHMDLAIAAKARYAEVTGDNSILAMSKPEPKPMPKKQGERGLRKLDG